MTTTPPEIDSYFERVILPLARHNDAATLVEWMEDQAALWRRDAGRRDGQPYAREIAEFLENLSAELFGAAVITPSLV